MLKYFIELTTYNKKTYFSTHHISAITEDEEGNTYVWILNEPFKVRETVKEVMDKITFNVMPPAISFDTLTKKWIYPVKGGEDGT